MKKIGHFLIVNPFTHALEITSLELNMAPGVLLEPYMSQGGQGVAETPIVSKGLRDNHVTSCTWLGITHRKIIYKKVWVVSSF